jgi:hypothetical protein
MKREEAVLIIAECLIEPGSDDIMREASTILAQLEARGAMQVFKTKTNYSKVFELICDTSGKILSYHKTLKGALDAMRDAVEKETPGMINAFEDDSKVDISLTYSIKSIELKQ